MVGLITTFRLQLLFLKRSYDTIAWFYDRLSRLVYGSTLVKAQQFLLQAIPANSQILIVGGGTGWVLDEISKVHPSGLHITYIDASAKMIVLAKKRNVGSNKITFITSLVEDAPLAGRYDVILTPFLFDNFTEASMRRIFSLLDNHLAPNDIWLYSDFRDTSVFWQKAMLKIMYFFFRTACGIEASSLPATEACFEAHQYRIREQKAFLNGFIISTIYERN